MTDERIIAYLLEELTAEEREQFEEDCFAQQGWPAQTVFCEEDLIDAYLRDELSPEQRRRFEQNYLTTDARQERVVMAAALLHVVDEKHPATVKAVGPLPARLTWAEHLREFWGGQGWAIRAAVALVLISVAAGAVWLFALRARPPRTFASLNLAASVDNYRNEGVQASKVKFPLGADALKISLKLPDQAVPSARYRAEVVDGDGETVPLTIAGQDAQSVSVVVPAEQLARGQYALKLFAVKDDGTEHPLRGRYFFTVE